MRTLALYNFKGGVGKTTAAVHLACLAARGGARTLLWDLDPQGAATFTLRVRPRSVGAGKLVRGEAHLEDAIRASDHAGLDLLPADFRLRKLDGALAQEDGAEAMVERALDGLAGQYDVVVLDCPPSISRLSEAVFHASDALIAPTIPTPLSLRTLAKLLGHLKGLPRRPPVLPFFSMVDRRKRLHREVIAYAEEKRLGFLATHVPSSSAVERVTVLRAPLFDFAPRDRAARAFEALWAEVLEARGDETRRPTRGEVRDLIDRARR